MGAKLNKSVHKQRNLEGLCTRYIAEWELKVFGNAPNRWNRRQCYEGWSAAVSAAREAFAASTIFRTSDGGIDIIVQVADKPVEDPADEAIVETWLI